MTDATVPEEEEEKSSKMPLIIGLVLALVGGGGGFFATSQGFILAPESKAEEHEEEAPKEMSKAEGIAFVPMDPLTVSMSPNSSYKHLLFRGELEVAEDYEDEVTTILPRIVDVLNSYLRALEISDIEEAASLTRLRSQMLRRVQVVAGPGRVNDLLIMEFVLN
ncbi:MAG: flagellar basal body-associated FliL family protein [Lentilitoribacter sp.]